MRSILASALVLVVGCGASTNVGEPCSLTEPCDNAVCDFEDPQGPTCIDKDGDLDGDGLRNDQDFCHHLPGGAFDEDGDGLGDECDPCPIAPPNATPDPDGDAVERPCDPDPSTPGDQIAVFDGFNNGLPDGWTATPGWSFVVGEAIATAGPAAEERLTAQLPLVSQNIALLGRYRIDAVDAQASTNTAGLIALDRRPAGGAEIACAGTRNGMTDRLVLQTDTAAASEPFGNLFDSASLYKVAMTLEGANAACAMVADDQTGATQARTGGEQMNEAGLVVQGATARFQYVMVIQRGSAVR